MRFNIPASLLSLALIAPVWAVPQDAAALEKALEPNVAADTISIQTAAAVPETKTEEIATPDDGSTIFNGVRVPPLRDINGEKFDEEVKSGYWFVKHHSPYCPHCHAVAPVWQTLYEFYYTSKPVTASTDNTDTSHPNDFQYYYNFHFASLDCIAFGTACDAHDVHAYPTFVLYKDGEPVKRFVGTKDMKGLSEFVEETLETIKPGSRVQGGPTLPEVGATAVAGFETKPTAIPASAPEVPAKAAAVPAKAAELPAKAAEVPAKAAEVPAKAAEFLAKGAGEVLKGNVVTTKSSTYLPSTATSTVEEVRLNQKPSKAAKPTVTPNPIGNSVSLTAESFQHLVTMSQEPWFIKFYAPWCHHCQAMAPNWFQLSKEMQGKLNVGEVNCEAESRLCKDVGVRGYPTVLFFRGGERVEYDGLRGLGDFVNFANKAIDVGDGVKDVDAVEFSELEEKEEVIFLYFYDHATTSEDFAALERLTLSLIGHAKLVKTNSAKLAERYKITTWPRLLVSRDGRPTYYTALAPKDMRDFRQVLSWMQSVWLPIVPELTASNSREIMDGKLVVLGILDRSHADDFVIAKKEIKSAALEWMDKQTQLFQLERQELRDSKQLRIEEAEDRNDQRALRAAKSIRINMDMSDRKEVGFAWVDGVFWERWIRTTYGIEVKDGEKVIINDEDNRRYWDTTITGNYIIPSRTSILETIPKVVANPPKIQPKMTISSFEKLFFNLKGAMHAHKYITMLILGGIIFGALYYGRLRNRRNGFFKLDDKEGILGNTNGVKGD